jgi:exopolysaccharide biosynthesis polyprenyl glycosylphosphotransferase
LNLSSLKRRVPPDWERRYAYKLFATDFLIVMLSVFGAQTLRFGFAAEELRIPVAERLDLGVTYTLVSISLATAWLLTLSIWDTREPTVFGTGPTEYKRVTRATLLTFGGYAIIAFVVRAEIGRGYLMIALPAGLFLLLFSRWLWRKRLHRQRERGLNMYRTLIVGEWHKIHHVTEQIRRDTPAGFELVGAVTEQGSHAEILPSLGVVADYEHLLDAVDRLQVNTVIITSTDNISPQRLREIGWELEARRVDLVVTAALTDVAGPRIHMRPVAGLPLIHVAYPEFTGRKFFAKRMFDLIFSSLSLVCLSPVFLVIAALVKFTSPGPVFFTQRRIGQGGRPFSMFKFRSMQQDAEDQLPGLLDQSEGNELLFKLKHDPRITKVGAWLRRYSLDELPQLANVFLGQMSLVGPRPPLPREVEKYEQWVHRRLLVRPGITGLWQVSGRSDLSWEDSIRLDLYYVENWSLMGDLVLVWRTVRAVTRPTGAY